MRGTTVWKHEKNICNEEKGILLQTMTGNHVYRQIHLLLALNLKPCWIHLKADVLPLRGCDHSPQQRFQQLLQICSTIDLCAGETRTEARLTQQFTGNSAKFWKLSRAWKHLICFGVSQIPVKTRVCILWSHLWNTTEINFYRYFN